MIATFPPEWSSAVRCCLETFGQRLGDILSLRWEQFDFENRVVNITTGKTGKTLVQPMRQGFVEWANKMKSKNLLHPRLAMSDFDDLYSLMSERKWRLNHLYWIENKDGKIVRFRMNFAQDDLDSNLWFPLERKARSMRMSIPISAAIRPSYQETLVIDTTSDSFGQTEKHPCFSRMFQKWSLHGSINEKPS